MEVRELLRRISIVFTAGCVGALLSSLLEWALGYAGITQMFKIDIMPVLSLGWLFPRLVWGGIWGLMFLLPFFGKLYFFRALFYSIPPSLAMLFVVYPLEGSGMFGVKLGSFTPCLVVLSNLVWAICAVTWLKLCENK